MPRRDQYTTTDQLQVVHLDDLVLMDELQVRVRLDLQLVRTYRDIFLSVPADKCTCPPITCFTHHGTLVVSDGHHRVAAAKLAKRTTLKAYVRQGSLDDAWLFAMNTNIRHGTPYSREDKQKIVRWFLEHPRYSDRSSRQIAELTGNMVPHSTVANIRNRQKIKRLEQVSKLDSRSRGGASRAEQVHQMARAHTRIRDAAVQILGVALEMPDAPEAIRQYAREIREAAIRLGAVLAELTQGLDEDLFIAHPGAEDEDEDDA